MKNDQETYLTIEETAWDYFIAPTQIVIAHCPRGPPRGEYYTITLGRADGEGEHQTIDLTPEQFDQIRRFNL